MTIDEAIEHAEHVAVNCEGECSEDHRQLAEWLRELRRARMEIEILKTLRDGFKADAQEYKAENEKLHEIVMLMYKYYVSGTLGECELCDWMLDCENHPALSCKHGDYYDRVEFANGVFETRVREFGIEVDDG